MQSTHTRYSLRTTIERFIEPCILLLLLKEKSHGYDLTSRLKSGFKITVNTGSLYRTLIKMQKAGVIESKRLQSNEGPSKKVYQITLSGKLALDAWVAALEEQQREVQLLLGKYRSLTDRDNAVSTNIETI